MILSSVSSSIHFLKLNRQWQSRSSLVGATPMLVAKVANFQPRGGNAQSNVDVSEKKKKNSNKTPRVSFFSSKVYFENPKKREREMIQW